MTAGLDKVLSRAGERLSRRASLSLVLGLLGVMAPSSASAAFALGEVCEMNAECESTICLDGICSDSVCGDCAPADQCHAAGVCDPNTGLCEYPPLADGTPCDDGNACTLTDTCQEGVCDGSAAEGITITCAPADQCHTAGVCDPRTGLCKNPPLADGTPCDDGNACTLTDTCQEGVCNGSTAEGITITCAPIDQCHAAGVCDPSTGLCNNPPLADGTSCDDGDVSTAKDICTAGTCGGAPVVCVALDECHDVGRPLESGVCSNPAKADGTACSIGACRSGVCSSNLMCATNADCISGTWCLPSTHTCVVKLFSGAAVSTAPACATDADCDAGQRCDDVAHTCEPTISSGSDIPMGSDHADPIGGGESSGISCTIGLPGNSGGDVAGGVGLLLALVAVARRRDPRAAE
jgi:hypothetical protein